MLRLAGHLRVCLGAEQLKAIVRVQALCFLRFSPRVRLAVRAYLAFGEQDDDTAMLYLKNNRGSRVVK